ncbi:DUF4259 domain-containing protein [Micromonospora sp. HK10]|uniref:DUF4259 domain-containing protein n=1 Tax=Micromonospora sp. HK10 TaxID=1538294 RepID=UPI000698F1FB|nr:DUF4259 domain-containing protein [Micromonospora sp. HK10]
MGTWGEGPFDSDGAEDFLDSLAELPPDARLGVVSRLLRSAAVPLAEWPRDLWDTEVIAAAAVLAVNISGDDPFDAEHEVTEWLPKQLPAELLSLGLRAIEEATTPSGPWAQSWTTDQSRADALDAITRIRSVLASRMRPDR